MESSPLQLTSTSDERADGAEETYALTLEPRNPCGCQKIWLYRIKYTSTVQHETYSQSFLIKPEYIVPRKLGKKLHKRHQVLKHLTDNDVNTNSGSIVLEQPFNAIVFSNWP